ncbi:MAG TPA: hypothetical protein PLL26_06935, partial [Candidatus Dojkabacteria bacterium]|nr:hypothetical protein [Candidatus Dojkabacteria bacterium]
MLQKIYRNIWGPWGSDPECFNDNEINIVLNPTNRSYGIARVSFPDLINKDLTNPLFLKNTFST